MVGPKTQRILLGLLILALVGVWYPHDSISNGEVSGSESAGVTAVEIIQQICGFLVTVLFAALVLSAVVHWLSKGRPEAGYGFAGWMALAIFASTVLSVHLFASVPIWLTGIAAIPSLIIPLVLERLRHPFQTISSPSERSALQPSFLLDQEIMIIEQALVSPVVGYFFDRYPNCKAYLYQEAAWDGHGGLLLANREKMNVPGIVFLDVTLTCPFGAKPGQFLLGQERIHSYFYRPDPQGGSYISLLPTQRWEEWLEGMTKLDWLVKMREVHHVPRLDIDIERLPYPIVHNGWRWKTLDLRSNTDWTSSNS